MEGDMAQWQAGSQKESACLIEDNSDVGYNVGCKKNDNGQMLIDQVREICRQG